MSHHAFRLNVFVWPAALALLNLIGLIGALLADGVWDLIGAGLLAVSLAVIVWARARASMPSAAERPATPPGR